jgi:hypothetical protein
MLHDVAALLAADQRHLVGRYDDIHRVTRAAV